MSDRVGPLTSVLLFTSPERHATMRAFYVETLGLEAAADREMHTAFDWRSGDLRLRLILLPHDRVEGTARDPHRIMLNFQVDDIHAVATRLRTAGVAFSRAPSQEPWGGWVATFEDPDGNTVQLLQPAD